MKRRCLSVLLALCMVVTLLPTTVLALEPASGTCGANLTWTLDSESTLTISGSGPMWNYDYNTQPWKDQLHSIKTVVINDGVTSIGVYAFYHCGSLTSVTIPDSVTSIGSYAFIDCCSLVSVTIPDSITSIGEGAFGGCEGLTSVTIPVSVTSIGDRVFLGCYALTDIEVDSGNKNYFSADGVLFDRAQTVLYTYPAGKRGPYTTMPTTVTSIGECAFSGCDGLTSVTIPDSVASIGLYAFQGCSSLTSVTIPDSVTTIGGYAFQGCSSLTSITIPASVTSITDSPFPDSLASVIIEDGVTSIWAYAFFGCKGLTSVTIPNSVTSIGDGAFRWCSGLTSVTIPDSVTSIGKEAFEGTGLTSVTIGNSVTSVGASAFRSCAGLTEVTIPNSVTSIESFAFYSCQKLTNVNYGGSEEQWKKISIGGFNDPLTNATIHYNSTGPDDVDPDKPPKPDGDSYIVDRVKKYTSDVMYKQYENIMTSNDSDETKYQRLTELFSYYGILDVREGISYLSNTIPERYAYLALTTNEMDSTDKEVFGNLMCNRITLEVMRLSVCFPCCTQGKNRSLR